MFHEIPLKLYFMKYSERKILQCILPLEEILGSDEINKSKRVGESQSEILLRKLPPE